jgi:methylthioribose-1-phosphate isomerase
MTPQISPAVEVESGGGVFLKFESLKFSDDGQTEGHNTPKTKRSTTQKRPKTIDRQWSMVRYLQAHKDNNKTGHHFACSPRPFSHEATSLFFLWKKSRLILLSAEFCW